MVNQCLRDELIQDEWGVLFSLHALKPLQSSNGSMGRCPSCGFSEHLVLLSGTAHVTPDCGYPCTRLSDGRDPTVQHSVRHSLKGRRTMNLITLGGAQGLKPRKNWLVLWFGSFWPMTLVMLTTTFTEHTLHALYTHTARPWGWSSSRPHFTTSLWEAGVQPVQKRQGLDWLKNRLFWEFLLHLPPDMGTGRNFLQHSTSCILSTFIWSKATVLNKLGDSGGKELRQKARDPGL